MLNRHAIVLIVGSSALVLLWPYPQSAYGWLGMALLASGLGLLLDVESGGIRSAVAHLVQGVGVAWLLATVVRGLALGEAPPHLILAASGIAFAVLGVWLEIRIGFRALRAAVAIQAVGDLLYISALAVAFLGRNQSPSTVGWTFIALAGLLSLYAAVYNLALQLRRLRHPQAGWRYRLVGSDGRGLRFQTPEGEAVIAWSHLEAIRQLDPRHLILILPAPLPPEIAATSLPLEQLQREAGATGFPDRPPDRYGLILHEQELGAPLSMAEASIQAHLSSPDAVFESDRRVLHPPA